MEHRDIGKYVTRFAAVCGLFASVLVSAQLLGSSWYMGCLLPGTTIGDQQVGGLSVLAATKKLTFVTSNYRVDLNIGDRQYTFSAPQLGVSYDLHSSLVAAYSNERSVLFFAPKNRTARLVYHVNTPILAAAVATVANQIGIQPVNANIDISNGKIETIAAKDGYSVDRISLARQFEQGLGSTTPAVLTAVPARLPASILAADLAPSIAATERLIGTQITLNYGTHVWTPTNSSVGSWLTFQTLDGSSTPKLVPTVDKVKLASYVASLAKQVDVSPVTQLTTITNSVTTINRVGVNGTAIDQAGTVSAITAALNLQQPLNYTITDGPVAFKSTVTNFKVLDLPSYVEVNLHLQHLWVWENGGIIYDSPITSGASAAGFPTAEGLFHIYYKSTNTMLNGTQYGPRYQYNDFVKFWMPFYQGYGLHDASWRNGRFGGQDYLHGGSHGCVNLPDATAAWMYNWSVVGTPVWVHE
jgi:lipoprotein-anchoring transpeptidase ErfK/SrfK